MTGVMAGQRSGLLGGILGAMLGGKQGREQKLYDKYLEQRLSNPSYGSEHTDRLMAQRYGGEGYIRAPVKSQPQRPIAQTQYSRGPKGRLWQQEGVIDPMSLEWTATGGVPHLPSERSTSAGARSQQVDEFSSSEIQGARQWWRALKKSDPNKFETIRTGNTWNVSVMDQNRIKLLIERDPQETREQHTAWLAEQEQMALPAPPPTEEPGRDYKGLVVEAYKKAKTSLLGEMSDTTPQNVSDLRRALEESGALTPQ
jgi:hypothetical protein